MAISVSVDFFSRAGLDWVGLWNLKNVLGSPSGPKKFANPTNGLLEILDDGVVAIEKVFENDLI